MQTLKDLHHMSYQDLIEIREHSQQVIESGIFGNSDFEKSVINEINIIINKNRKSFH